MFSLNPKGRNNRLQGSAASLLAESMVTAPTRCVPKVRVLDAINIFTQIPADQTDFFLIWMPGIPPAGRDVACHVRIIRW